MYSTSTAKTTVPWAAATYNIAIDTEIGHFDYCTKINAKTDSCAGKEGLGANQEPADGDHNGCFPGSASTLIKITGCLDTNLGYDGTSYLRDWPDGTASTPTPAIFTSPKTGSNYDQQYAQLAFNTDLPAIEQSLTPTCNGDTGANCTVRPPTDDGQPAQFYPYYSAANALGGCAFTVGQDVPGEHQRLRPAQPVRLPAQGHLPNSRWRHPELVQRLLEGVAEQPLPSPLIVPTTRVSRGQPGKQTVACRGLPH
jgi:hypothetical protein